MKNIKVIVATHKKYQMPEENMYLPVFVGAEGKEENITKGYQRDDKGENISGKNPYYCELTGLYWAWKNLDADYIGLVHYRRYFTMEKHLPKDEENRFEVVLKEKETKKLLEEADILLPKKRHYYIENLYAHYIHTMYGETLEKTRNIIENKYPEYLPEFDKLKKRTSAHMFNMFIMKREYLDKYCTFLFSVLDDLEKRVDITKYDSFHARFFGRISELLLDIWLETNHLNYKEIKVMDMQPINWIHKGSSFLMAKFMGKKYEKSF